MTYSDDSFAHILKLIQQKKWQELKGDKKRAEELADEILTECLRSKQKKTTAKIIQFPKPWERRNRRKD